MTNQERYDDIITALDIGRVKLNDWEREFLDKTDRLWLSKGKELTWPHQKKLIQIWEKIE